MLNFSILSRQDEDSSTPPTLHYLDVWGQLKQGRSFLEFSVDFLYRELKKMFPGTKELHFWADGGLKTVGSISALAKLSSDYSVTLNHFASYHGHNPCDAHFSVVKRRLKSLGKNGMIHPKEIENLSSSLTRTTMIQIPSNTASLYTNSPLTDFKVKSYHSFTFQGQGDQFSVLAHPTNRNSPSSEHFINTSACFAPPLKVKPSKSNQSPT